MKAKVKTDDMKLRIPTELKAWLESRADENGRSNNMEIVQILKAAQQAEQQRTAA